LKALADRRVGVYPEPGSALGKLEAHAEAGPQLARLKAELPVVRRGRVLTVMERPALIPEGIVQDASRQRLLIGDMSNRAILSLDRNGVLRPWVTGLSLRPLGMKIRDGRLWLAATNAFWDEKPHRAELIVLDLATGRRLATFTHPEARSFNDLDFTAAGDLYASDSIGGTVFRLRAGAKSMERLLPPATLNYPNGIAANPDGTAVYVAHGLGPTRIDPGTGTAERLPKPADLPLVAIDGLYWRDGALIAVQSLGAAGRVLRLELDPEGRRIQRSELLEAGGPHLTSPSTAAVGRDRLYVLANAQVRKLKGDGSIEAPLEPAVVLELPLKRPSS
jgi:sugar lactone lactonase YvrE